MKNRIQAIRARGGLSKAEMVFVFILNAVIQTTVVAAWAAGI